MDRFQLNKFWHHISASISQHFDATAWAQLSFPIKVNVRVQIESAQCWRTSNKHLLNLTFNLISATCSIYCLLELRKPLWLQIIFYESRETKTWADRVINSTQHCPCCSRPSQVKTEPKQSNNICKASRNPIILFGVWCSEAQFVHNSRFQIHTNHNPDLPKQACNSLRVSMKTNQTVVTKVKPQVLLQEEQSERRPIVAGNEGKHLTHLHWGPVQITHTDCSYAFLQ